MNLQFNDSTKVLPRHGQEVWYVSIRSGFFDYYGFNLATVEYQWQTEDGNACCYDPNDPEPPEPDIDAETGEKIPYFLRVYFNNEEASLGKQIYGQKIWWIDCEEVEKQIKEQ